MKPKVFNLEVIVTGNIERSLRQMKKRVEREGVLRDIKKKAHHETETQIRRKNFVRAVKKNVIDHSENMLFYSKLGK